MTRGRLAWSAIAIVACAPAAHPGETAGTGPTIEPAVSRNTFRVLSSDEFLGRGPATAGGEKTVAYLTEQMRAAGLQPGGLNGSWYQDVPLARFASTA